MSRTMYMGSWKGLRRDEEIQQIILITSNIVRSRFLIYCNNHGVNDIILYSWKCNNDVSFTKKVKQHPHHFYTVRFEIFLLPACYICCVLCCFRQPAILPVRTDADSRGKIHCQNIAYMLGKKKKKKIYLALVLTHICKGDKKINTKKHFTWKMWQHQVQTINIKHYKYLFVLSYITHRMHTPKICLIQYTQWETAWFIIPLSFLKIGSLLLQPPKRSQNSQKVHKKAS